MALLERRRAPRPASLVLLVDGTNYCKHIPCYEVSLDQVRQKIFTSADVDEHAEKIQSLIDSGVTEVYVHSGQYDQRRALAFSHDEVLPRLHTEHAQA